MNIDVKLFLKKNRNSVIREKVINYKFFYDIKLAGARNNKDIQISFPEVDKEGYDLILDAGEGIKVFQVKTRLIDATTTSWKVQKQLLRPTFENLELLGFEATGQNMGYEGGVILIEINPNKNTLQDFQYYFCNIFILKAIELKIIPTKSKTQYNAVLRLLNDLQSDGRFNRYEKIVIPKGAFVKARDIDSLLALADLKSIKEDYRWWFIELKQFLKNEESINEKMIISKLKNLIIN